MAVLRDDIFKIKKILKLTYFSNILETNIERVSSSITTRVSVITNFFQDNSCCIDFHRCFSVDNLIHEIVISFNDFIFSHILIVSHK